MLSNTCKTAIKAVIYLASKHDEGGKYSIQDISAKIEASEHTVGKVLQILVKQGLINSLKGPSGGFFINAKQINLPLMNIIEAVDGKQVFKECGLGLTRCSEKHPCPIHHLYKEGREIIEKLFGQTRVTDLREAVSNGIAFLIA
jgi:Rrf2 family protein